MSLYLLDTNICIELLHRKNEAVFNHLCKLEDIAIVGVSSITVSELEYGSCKSARCEENRRGLMEFFTEIEIFDFDAAAAEAYGGLRAYLEKQGQVIGPLDMLIVAHALALAAVLVTNNEREFLRGPGIEIQNWVK